MRAGGGVGIGSPSGGTSSGGTSSGIGSWIGTGLGCGMGSGICMNWFMLTQRGIAVRDACTDEKSRNFRSGFYRIVTDGPSR